LFEVGRLWDNGDLILPTHDSGKFGEEVRDKLVNDLNDQVNIIGWICDKFEEWEGMMIQKIVDATLLESMDMEKMEGSISFLCRENFAYALGYEWFECLKEEQLPFPPGWTQNEWYWELAKEFAKRDMGKICTTERSSVVMTPGVVVPVANGSRHHIHHRHIEEEPVEDNDSVKLRPGRPSKTEPHDEYNNLRNRFTGRSPMPEDGDVRHRATGRVPDIIG